MDFLEKHLENRLGALEAAWPSIQFWLLNAGANSEQSFNAHLALEELLTNVIRHSGHRDSIPIRLAFDQGRLTIEMRDKGAPFDPRTAPEPRLDQTLETRRPGGLGIHMIRCTARDIRYRRENGQNVIQVDY